MNVLTDKEGKTCSAMTMESPDDFCDPFAGVVYPCLIWDHDGHFSQAQRVEVAKRLLDSGCRYAVCGGRHSEAWHDVVDEAFVVKHQDESDEVREAMYVMTTCHESESPEEVAFFFVCCTCFDQHDFSRYLVLHIGHGPLHAELEAAVKHTCDRFL